ncbi:MAG: IS200/IS605 family accessory protein TnpB-related protein, partial [Chlamydiales bacterium]
NKESRIIRDLNHKISKKIVTEVVQTNSGIVLEELKGIRKTAETSKKIQVCSEQLVFLSVENVHTI